MRRRWTGPGVFAGRRAGKVKDPEVGMPLLSSLPPYGLPLALLGLGLAACGGDGTPVVHVVNADLAGDATEVYVAGYVSGCDCGAGGFVRRWAGAGWETEVQTEAELWGLWVGDDGLVIAVGTEGEVAARRGGVWTAESAPDAGNLHAAWGAAADDVYAVGDTLAHHDGSGWALVEAQLPGRAWGVWGASPDDVFVVGEGGFILHYDGAAWTEQASGTALDLRRIWGSASDDVYAVGGSSESWEAVVLHYDGAAWSTVELRPDAVWLGVHGTAPNELLFVGAERGDRAVASLVLGFDGAEWSRRSAPAIGYVWDAWLASDGGYFLAGPDDLLYYFVAL